MRPLRIAYLLEDTAQSGGVRVPLAQADELIARGHRVRMVSKGQAPSWRSSRAEWFQVSDFGQYDSSGDDFILATFWSTVTAAWEMAGRRAIHLCQGYEGAFSAYQPIRARIDFTYALPLPKIVVARPLVEICRRFTPDVTYIGQAVDDEFYRDQVPPEHDPPRVLLAGQAQGDLKGVDDGYGAVAYALSAGAGLSLIRVSPWPPSSDEPLENVEEFHVALSTAEMTRLMHSCDVLLAPNHAEEGFGLPAAEAMASGIPCLVTEIPSYLSFDDTHDYALFRPARDPRALGDGLLELLGDRELRARVGRRAREVAEQFRVTAVVDRLETFLRERRDRAVTASAQTRTSGR
ncbi:MAG TPA: glycosyltransferase family 4 protein [Thermoanaerobaculia bacterium]|nr:glycosyltransferase family 4 protein [Thermoanaerobaculia bacterium]